MSSSSDRLAPAQCSAPVEENFGGSEHNLWWGHKNSKRKRPPPRGVEAKTRCLLVKHSGRTRGGASADTCLYFAQGCCHLGHRCVRRHRVPGYAEEMALDVQRDVFGRQRDASEGDV